MSISTSGIWHSRIFPICVQVSIACMQFPLAFAGEASPTYCGTSGLTEAQEIECAKPKNANQKEQVGSLQLIPPRYPVKIQLLGLRDEYNLGKPIEVDLHAKSSKELRVQHRNSDLYLLIPSERIVGWGLGEQNGVDTSGAIGMAAGALFFPPMLLAIPFGITNTRTNIYQVQYLDQYGVSKSIVLSATGYHRETVSLLRYLSGLRPGVPRDELHVRQIETETLEQLVRQRDEKEADLVVSNPKKPWCEYLDPGRNPTSHARYQQLNGYISSLSVKLKKPVLEGNIGKSDNQRWEDYLDKNPGLRQWALAYPKQAAQLRSCPEMSSLIVADP